MDAIVTELAVAQTGDGVIFVKPLGGLGGRLYMPFDQRQAERSGDLVGQHGLAGTRFALDQ